VPDLKPPRIVGDDRATMQLLLLYHRESFVRKVSGVDEEAACRPMVPSGTSLLWLTQHLAHAEKLWFLVRFAGEDVDMTQREPLAAAIDEYRATWQRVDALIARSSLDDMCRNIDVEPNTSLRWVLAHMLEETARHAGHADIIRELIDGDTGR
jgi:hypothetical protein